MEDKKQEIRYEHLDKKDPDYRRKFAQQLAQADEDARAGKIICLTDLFISAGM
jgi:hypothetical protein